jgi:hypothetical protein
MGLRQLRGWSGNYEHFIEDPLGTKRRHALFEQNNQNLAREILRAELSLKN